MYSQLTQQIHAEVSTAYLETVKYSASNIDIFNNFRTIPKDEELQLLIDLKFVSNPKYQTYAKEYNELKDIQEVAVKIKKLQDIYPGYLILTEKQVDSICKKYKLDRDKLDVFKEDVPLFNLRKIAAFVKQYPEYRLSIIAPREMFSEKPQGDDPIVVHRHDSYYIVVTMWGKEQTIPELQNSINN